MRWKLVPVEPTEAVIQAFVDQVPHDDFFGQAITDYAAMLAAAPSAADDPECVERVARAIATENGDDFDAIHTSKAHWNATRGGAGGRYRDINEPRQSDYLDMARAAIKAMDG